MDHLLFTAKHTAKKCDVKHTQNTRFWLLAMPCLTHEAEDIGG